ncbi:hypothetical protein AB4Y85_16500 [Microvirga sp. 2YAF29]|uniref:hypothetical protein n=1 Tax=Microvirga sp. 2YAF29 TaxID=3233031 RepID=UPI003F9A93B6
MRIGWASPFNEQSSIARYSLRVCEELRRRGIRAEIIRTEGGAEETPSALDSSLPVYPPAEYTTEFLETHFDLCVVNAAREAMDHERIIDIARRFQVVTIFHEQDASNGDAESVEGAALPSDPGEIDWIARLASLSTGAVVHADRDHSKVCRLCAGPVALLPIGSLDAGADLPVSIKEMGADTVATVPLPEGEGCVEKYVDALIEVLDEALHRAPLRNAGWTIGATVAEMGLAWDDPLSSRLGHEMSALFEEAGGAESDKN